MIIIELVDHLGRVRERHQFKDGPIRVGRGYDNDLILSDPFICDHHLELEPQADGSLLARDLDSLNGLYLHGSKKRVESVLLADDDKMRIGHTTLRYRTPEHVVEATRQDRLSANLFNTLLNSNAVLWLGYLVLALFITLLTYLGSYTEFEAIKVFRQQLLPYTVMILAWAGFWALLSRINIHSFYFKAHSIIATTTIFLSLLYEELLAPLLRFALNLDAAVDQLTQLFSFLLVAAALYAHLRFCTTQSSRRLVLYAFLASFVLGGVSYMESFEGADDFSSYPRYQAIILPPVFQAVDDKTLNEFFAEAKQLDERLQLQIEKDE